MPREYKTFEEKQNKNSQIKATMKATFEKRKQQKCFVFQCKIDESQLSKKQKEELKMSFIETKWLKNDILRWSSLVKENKPWDYIFNGKVTHQVFNKDIGKPVDKEDELIFLGGSVRQQVQKQICANIRTLSTLKKKGYKIGKIKFCKKYTDLDFNHYGTTYKIISSKRMKFQGVSKAVVVNGLKQFYEKGYDYANCKIVDTPKGYYIMITCFLDKNKIIENKKIDKVIGIDFGCMDSFVTSEGEKFDVKVQESERLKKLQRKFDRQTYEQDCHGHFILKEKKCKDGKVRKLKVKKQVISKSRQKTLLQIQKEYQKQTNIKNDKANKLVSKFKQYKAIVIQDEQLSKWQKSGHGKAVQHSILGRVKTKLKQNPNTVVLDKWAPTTKLCRNCGTFHDEIRQWHRTFVCKCGVKQDRDVHAAQNMVWMYKNNLGMEHTKFTRPEMEKLVLDALNYNNENYFKARLLSMKVEGPYSSGKN
jgi:putative transposase